MTQQANPEQEAAIRGENFVRAVAESPKEVPQTREDGVPEVLGVAYSKEIPSLAGETGKGAAAAKRPALHINIQVHIDPTASAEQIDQIFAGMARHFYGDAA